VGGGLSVGVVLTLLARRWVGSLLFQTSPGDPAIILAVGGTLLVVAAVAVVVPTARILRQSPATVLRLE
jgi:ABC-type antimicrobial peptide transport system permease subunit